MNFFKKLFRPKSKENAQPEQLVKVSFLATESLLDMLQKLGQKTKTNRSMVIQRSVGLYRMSCEEVEKGRSLGFYTKDSQGNITIHRSLP